MGVTQYFRKALASQMNPRIDFKDSFFLKITREQAEQGIITAKDANSLFDSRKENGNDKFKRELPVLIAVKTMKPEIVDARKTSTSLDELTAVFFLPALLTQGGDLLPPQNKRPWFAREFLTPMVDPEISVGASEDVDRFLRDNTAERVQIDSWEKYWTYMRKMYEAVTHTGLDSNRVGSLENVEADEFCYVFCDELVFSTTHILNLYDSIIESRGEVQLPLYEQFVALDPKPTRALVEDSSTTMQRHCGQMGGEYPLSPSQREALNHLDALENGEILAISGPPGTGKTTLLQSVVANLVTDHALNQNDPPIIVATSTNNQAVTNIIDSFGGVNALGIRNLESRWVSVVDSFAVFYPSSSKDRDARYQIGTNLLTKISSQEVIDQSANEFLKQCSSYFSQSMQNIRKCREKIHQELTAVDRIRKQMLVEFEELMQRTKGNTITEYTHSLQQICEVEMAEIRQIKTRCQTLQKKIDGYTNRIQEWNVAYKKLPWHVRLFSFISAFNKKVVHWTKTFKNESELVDLESAKTPKMVLQHYQQQIVEIENDIYEHRKKAEKIHRQLDAHNAEIEQIQKCLNVYADKAESLKKYSVDLIGQRKRRAIRAGKCEPSIREILSDCDLNGLNELIDTSARYVEFWLAVHYYECVWLESKPLTEKQLRVNYEDVVKKGFRNLSMLTPCMVMTFFMLPKQFAIYKGQNDYLYNYIDLLIVDEAGQTSPEIAAPAFALAKRAVVVGDEQQITPVWGVKRSLDIAMAQECGIIDSEAGFKKLEESGLNTSESSVMRVSSQSCPYEKYDKGLFLCEHRRCYDEIINYCNDLVYKKKLQPCRGKAAEDPGRPEIMTRFPVVGYFDIPAEHSKKVGTSRINQMEAKRIAQWLKVHYAELCKGYSSLKTPVEEKGVLAIITPFKGQVRVIKEELNAALGAQSRNITVGTVHTFQGGERRIIIFSTVYGSADGCFFIDREKNLMNVAVSRAKDAFWVFGSIKCLEGKTEQSASGLLNKYIKDHEIMP